MDNLATQEGEKLVKNERQDAKKAFLLNVVFFALLIALYFVNQSTSFLDSLVTRLFE